VKRLLAVGLGAFGVRALLRRRRASGSVQADELREKLAARRSDAEPAPAPPPAPPAAQEPEPEPEREPEREPEPDGVEARRAEVHARARRRIDELSGDS
jgi:hypothetical protein